MNNYDKNSLKVYVAEYLEEHRLLKTKYNMITASEAARLLSPTLAPHTLRKWHELPDKYPDLQIKGGMLSSKNYKSHLSFPKENVLNFKLSAAFISQPSRAMGGDKNLLSKKFVKDAQRDIELRIFEFEEWLQGQLETLKDNVKNNFDCLLKGDPTNDQH